MSIFTKLKTRLIKYRSSRIYLIVAVLQLLVALSLLIPTIYNVEQILVEGYEIDRNDPVKVTKLRYESAIYIVFEIWRLWLVLDGIIQMNSLTIYTTAALAVFSVGLSLMTLNEYSKLESDIAEIQRLIFINLIYQVAFSCALFVFAIPTSWFAYKVKKDFGWGIYKKIGSSLDLQKMYQVVQCFSLIIKIDVFFELAFIIVLTISFASDRSLALLISTPLLTFISIIIAREAIARENHILMVLFHCLQIEFMTASVYLIFIEDDQFSGSKFVFTEWYAFALFFVCSTLCFLISITLAIWCQINFNKELKEHVQWSFFGLKRLSNKNNQNDKDDSNGLLSTKIDIPIDDD